MGKVSVNFSLFKIIENRFGKGLEEAIYRDHPLP